MAYGTALVLIIVLIPTYWNALVSIMEKSKK
jgi:hypothetical protein